MRDALVIEFIEKGYAPCDHGPKSEEEFRKEALYYNRNPEARAWENFAGNGESEESAECREAANDAAAFWLALIFSGVLTRFQEKDVVPALER